MAAIGPILAPAMKERGAREGDTAALLAASGRDRRDDPPSLVLIIIGSVTGISIAALFTGGLLPGVVCMLALAVAVYFRARIERATQAASTRAPSASTFIIALPALILPLIIRAAVLEGIATATEVAVIGIAYTLVAGMINDARRVDARRWPICWSIPSPMSGAVMIIIALAGAMAWALTQSGFAQSLAQCMTHLPGGKVGFLAATIADVRGPRQHPGGNPGDCTARPASDPGRNRARRASGALLDGGAALDGPRPCSRRRPGYGYYTACATPRSRRTMPCGTCCLTCWRCSSRSSSSRRFREPASASSKQAPTKPAPVRPA